ncbi:unnamed protein product, partial [Candidula unifasciata]
TARMSTPLLLLLLLALLAMGVTSQKLIACRQDCRLIKCAKLTPRNCRHTIVKNAGLCGCCDACIKIH